jgi:SAM-dependent methyltransferase
MTTDEETSAAARAAELLRTLPATSDGGGLRGVLRRVALRAMRPFTFHQRELDEAIVGALVREESELLRSGRRHDERGRRQDERIERLEWLALELIATAESLRRAAQDAHATALDASANARTATSSAEALRDQLDALPFMENEPFGALQTPVGEAYGFGARAQIADAESGYVAFENLFRGSAQRVAESQQAYKPLLEGHQPVLDVGCGRGELLALLAVAGIAASGVDTDPGMVAHCVSLGLDVRHGDSNSHLSSLPDGSLGSIFSAQVIEHLPYAELQELMRLASRKLAPGGLFIAETVNPHKIASLKTFWVDLTHQHPIFPEVALALCAIAGFASAYVFAPGFDSFPQARFRAPAYAVVATSAEAPA